MCSKKPTYRVQTVAVVVDNAGNSQFYFPKNQTVENAKRIRYIESYSVGQVAVSPDGNALPLQDDAAYKSAFMTLVTKGTNEQRIALYPLQSLNRINNNGQLIELDIPKLDFQRCFVTVKGAVPVVNKVFLLAFHYELEGDVTAPANPCGK